MKIQQSLASQKKKTTVGVIAPSSPTITVSTEQRRIGIANLAAFGDEIRFSTNFDAKAFHTAGSKVQRITDLQWALEDPEIDVIMPIFGGQNSNQLLPYIKYSGVDYSKKTLIGFSDVTALLLAFYSKNGTLKLVHGPTFVVFCDPGLFRYTIVSFIANIQRSTNEYSC